MKYISFDIDGVMNNYPICWIDYVNRQLNANFNSREEIKLSIGEEKYKEIKDQYRNSDYKAELKFNEKAKELADIFIQNDFKIIIATSRPFNNPKYKNLKQNTLKWLKNNNFHYDLFVDKVNELNNMDIYENIVLHIDDEIKYAQIFSNKGVRSIVLNSSTGNNISNISFVNSLDEIIKNWKQYV